MNVDNVDREWCVEKCKGIVDAAMPDTAAKILVNIRAALSNIPTGYMTITDEIIESTVLLLACAKDVPVCKSMVVLFVDTIYQAGIEAGKKEAEQCKTSN